MPRISSHLPSLTDDEVRWLAVRTAASLARFWARIRCALLSGHGRSLRVQDLPSEHKADPCLDEAPSHTAVSEILQAAQLAWGCCCSRPPPDYRPAPEAMLDALKGAATVAMA